MLRRKQCAVLSRVLAQAWSPLDWISQPQYHSLLYRSHGEPSDVIEQHESEVREPDPDELCVDWLAAPVNPSDINQVQGTYPIKPELPAVPGNEGVGLAVRVGAEVASIEPGDRVVAAAPGQGTWCERGTYKAAALHRVSAELPLHAAACATINPPTALRLLEDTMDLREGDVVVQNGANSAVGQLVIQIAASRKIKTVNVVRDRPELAELRDQLIGLGADVVTTEANLRKDFSAAGLPKPRLALNCVGGKASAVIAGLLGQGGVVVTYGGMSKQPLQVPTGSLIFKGISARGFWLSGGSRRQIEDIRRDIDRAARLYLDGTIKSRVALWDMQDAVAAVAAPRKTILAEKIVLLTERGREVLAKE